MCKEILAATELFESLPNNLNIELTLSKVALVGGKVSQSIKDARDDFDRMDPESITWYLDTPFQDACTHTLDNMDRILMDMLKLFRDEVGENSPIAKAISTLRKAGEDVDPLRIGDVESKRLNDIIPKVLDSQSFQDALTLVIHMGAGNRCVTRNRVRYLTSDRATDKMHTTISEARIVQLHALVNIVSHFMNDVRSVVSSRGLLEVPDDSGVSVSQLLGVNMLLDLVKSVELEFNGVVDRYIREQAVIAGGSADPKAVLTEYVNRISTYVPDVSVASSLISLITEATVAEHRTNAVTRELCNAIGANRRQDK